MNASFDQTVHCIAAGPDATFLRVSVHDGNRQEVAYETAVLGRLRRGYRILQLRGPLGTRIELCYLFVKISFGKEPNEWANPRQARLTSQLTCSFKPTWLAPFGQLVLASHSHLISSHDLFSTPVAQPS